MCLKQALCSIRFLPKILEFTPSLYVLCIRYLSRFFDCWAHQTTYAYIGNKHFVTKMCHRQTYQNSKISWQKNGSILVINCFKNWSFQKMSITNYVPLNWYSSMKKKFRKIRIIFDIENSLWKSKFVSFWQGRKTRHSIRRRL